MFHRGAVRTENLFLACTLVLVINKAQLFQYSVNASIFNHNFRYVESQNPYLYTTFEINNSFYNFHKLPLARFDYQFYRDIMYFLICLGKNQFFDFNNSRTRLVWTIVVSRISRIQKRVYLNSRVFFSKKLSRIKTYDDSEIYVMEGGLFYH